MRVTQTLWMIHETTKHQVGQRVRWKILGELPFVADVMVNIAVETKPCPAMSSLRPQEDIEQASFALPFPFGFVLSRRLMDSS